MACGWLVPVGLQPSPSLAASWLAASVTARETSQGQPTANYGRAGSGKANRRSISEVNHKPTANCERNQPTADLACRLLQGAPRGWLFVQAFFLNFPHRRDSNSASRPDGITSLFCGAGRLERKTAEKHDLASSRLKRLALHRALRRMAGLAFLLVSGCWRALAKGTAWAFFIVHFTIIINLFKKMMPAAPTQKRGVIFFACYPAMSKKRSQKAELPPWPPCSSEEHPPTPLKATVTAAAVEVADVEAATQQRPRRERRVFPVLPFRRVVARNAPKVQKSLHSGRWAARVRRLLGLLQETVGDVRDVLRAHHAEQVCLYRRPGDRSGHCQKCRSPFVFCRSCHERVYSRRQWPRRRWRGAESW